MNANSVRVLKANTPAASCEKRTSDSVTDTSGSAGQRPTMRQMERAVLEKWEMKGKEPKYCARTKRHTGRTM